VGTVAPAEGGTEATEGAAGGTVAPAVGTVAPAEGGTEATEGAPAGGGDLPPRMKPAGDAGDADHTGSAS
jgi:hypothetical protein